MKNNLYHYVHCPYCIRVRIASGFLNVPYESRVLSYDNIKLPEKLTGKKMLPIMEFADNEVLNESLDIISKIDDKKELFHGVTEKDIQEYEIICNEIGSFLHPLAMPTWLNTPEFYNESKTYFREKKEKKRGPFVKLVERASDFKNELSLFLDSFFVPKNFIKGDKLTVLDIMIAAHLYGVYTLIDFYVPKNIHEYLQRVRKVSNFNYHDDFHVNNIFKHWDE